LEEPGVDGKIILRWALEEVGCVGKELINLAKDTDRWGAVVNALMNLRDP
jgi:hypothetical protein